jgi:hypothetical protein
MRSTTASSLAFSIYLILSISIVGFTEPLLPEAEFALLTGPAPFASVEDLLNNPTKIAYELDTWRQDGDKIIRTESDVHAIYPYPLEFFLQELLDFENTKDVYSMVRESTLEYASDDPFGKHSLMVRFGVKVLGFGAEYTYVTDSWTEELGSGYLQKYRLNRCPDGTLYQLRGSWYIDEIIHNGEPHTYIRNYAIIGIQKGSLAMELAIRTFGIWQLQQVFNKTADAVQKAALQ